MKSRIFGVIALCGVSLMGAVSAQGQTVSSLDDIVIWAGTGSNEMGFVFAWNDPSSSANLATLAWGYRWSGSATGADALTAILATDPRLFGRLDSATGSGISVFGFGYDANDNGSFGVTGAEDPLGASVSLSFVNGISDTNINSSLTDPPFSSAGAGPSDSGDYYIEGWFDNGFWELTEASGPGYPMTWGTPSSFGLSTLSLVNDSWLALSNSNNAFGSIAVGSAVAAIPEPSTAVLVISGFSLLLLLRRRPCPSH